MFVFVLNQILKCLIKKSTFKIDVLETAFWVEMWDKRWFVYGFIKRKEQGIIIDNKVVYITEILFKILKL